MKKYVKSTIFITLNSIKKKFSEKEKKRRAAKRKSLKKSKNKG